MIPDSAPHETEVPRRGISRPAWLVLFLMPTLGALGPFLSLSPGSSGAPYAYRVLIGLAAVPALVLLARNRVSGAVTRALFFTTLAFLVWGTLALGWTPNTERGGRQLTGILIGILGCWVALALAGDHRSGRLALRRGFVMAAVVLSMIGIWQYVTGDNLWIMFGQSFNFTGNPLIGSFINPNNYAAFLLGCVGPILAMAIAGVRRHRVLGIALIGTLAWVLLNTESRTGALGLALICGMACVIVGIKLPKSQTPMLLGSLGLLALLALNLGKVNGLLSGVRQGTDSSDDLRVQLSKIAFRYFVESRGIGIGPAGFELKLESDPSAHVIKLLPPHNTFLEMAAEYGAPVIVPFLFLMGYLIAAALKRLPSDSSDLTSRRVELLACVIAIVAGALVASSLIADPSWWLLIGYTVVLARRADEVPRDDADQEDTPGLRSRSRATTNASSRAQIAQHPTKQTATAAS